MNKLIPFSTIGAFALAAIVVLIAGILFFGSGKVLTPSQQYVLFFDQSVNGLSAGSVVKFRGVEVGVVDRISLGGSDAENPQVAIFIKLYQSTDLQEFRSMYDFSNPKLVATLIDRGLKAQLLSQSILSGELYLSLDFHPEKEASFVLGDSSGLIEIPSIESGLIEEFTASSADLSSQLSLALEKLQKVLTTFDTKLEPLTNESLKTMKDVQKVINTVNEFIDPDSPFGYQVPKTLAEVEKSAKAIRLLAEYLERNPSSIIFGKRRVEVVEAQ